MRPTRCLFAIGFATALAATTTTSESDLINHHGPAQDTSVSTEHDVFKERNMSWENNQDQPLNKVEDVLLEIPLPGGLDQAGTGRGWLARWMALGGEGEVVVHAPSGNLTYPHRPAAFPQNLPQISRLPLSGILSPITFFSDPPSTHHTTSAPKSPPHPMQACLPPAWPPIRWQPPNRKPKRIALVERGGCDFATKVQAAQERGASAVIVGDTAPEGEEREDGRRRTGGLITMFSPEDTENIHIPSVFISRWAYLDLLDLIHDAAASEEGLGEIWIDIGDGADENATLGGMVSFALLMPSCFLLATIAIHRIRVTRQKEQDRAPPQVVLSLPERVWQPDIVWEKDDSPLSSPSGNTGDPTHTPHRTGSDGSHSSTHTARPSGSPQRSPSRSGPSNPASGLPFISAKDIPTPPAVNNSNPFEIPTASASGSGPSRVGQQRTKSSGTITHKRRYFSKDECAICMDEFQPGDVVRILPCGHVFHKEECDEWLLKWRKLCPTCRADVTLPPGSSTPQVGIRFTPVDGLPLPGDFGQGAGGGWGERVGLASRAASRWMGQTRGRLFGRHMAVRDGDGELGETTPLVQQGEQRGETSV